MLPTYYAGGVATVESWLDWYDDAARARYPTIAVLGAWVYYPDRTTRGAAPAGSARRRRSTATPELPDGSASIEPWIATLRGFTCPDGIERMLADAELALDQLGPEGWWRPIAQLAAGGAHALLGDAERARPALVLATELAAAAGAREARSWPSPSSRLLAMEAGAWEEAATHAGRSGARSSSRRRLDDYLGSGLAHAAAARVAVHRGDVTQAREHVARIHRLRPLLNHGLPWLSVQIGLELARVHLALGEPGVAGTVLSEAEAILRVRPAWARWPSWRASCGSASRPRRRRAASGR